MHCNLPLKFSSCITITLSSSKGFESKPEKKIASHKAVFKQIPREIFFSSSLTWLCSVGLCQSVQTRQ